MSQESDCTTYSLSKCFLHYQYLLYYKGKRQLAHASPMQEFNQPISIFNFCKNKTESAYKKKV
jgi:hypothetical protein